MSEIEAEKLWKKIFPPECYKNFWTQRCLDHLKTEYVFNGWEIFARCPHAHGCAVYCGYTHEQAMKNVEMVERNRIQNLKIARRRLEK